MNMVTEDYVSFEVAKLLKEKGFNANTEHDIWYVVENFSTGCHWNSCTYKVGDITREYDEKCCIVMPTLQMAMKWLRKNHSIFIATEFGWFHGDYEYQAYVVKMNPTIPPTLDSIEYIKAFRNKSYEIACESSIKYCLTNLVE